MIKNFFVAIICGGLVSCTGNNNNSSAPAMAASVSSSDVASLSQFYQDDVQSGVQNSANGAAILGGNTSLLEFSTWGAFFFPEPGCVTVTNNSSGANKNITLTFNCNYVTGTLNIQSASGSYTLTTQVSLTNPNNSQDTSTVDSTDSYSNSAGVVTMTRQFDNTFTNGTNSYQVRGGSMEVITPTNTANPGAGGTVQLNSSVDYLKNGSDLGMFTVSSSGLEYDSCGLDAGSVTMVNGSNTYVLTFNGCGNTSLTDNGSPLPN